jgi:putative intracellular protease/amidase
MEIAILLFDRITALDAVGTYEVLSRLPDANVTFVAKQVGLQRTENRMLALTADRLLDELPHPQIIVLPGGFGTRALAKDTQVLDWIREAHEASVWTTSVCTGSLLLGWAQGIQLGIEYGPEPPFVGGSPRTAPAQIIELVKARAAELA